MNAEVLLLALAAMLLAFLAGTWAGAAQAQGKRSGGLSEAKAQSVTRQLMIHTQRCALVWVSCSYLIAFYAVVRLGVVYTLEELSKPAITVLLGVNLAKVLENIFEHNENAVFGRSKKAVSESDTGDL